MRARDICAPGIYALHTEEHSTIFMVQRSRQHPSPRSVLIAGLYPSCYRAEVTATRLPSSYEELAIRFVYGVRAIEPQPIGD